MLGHPSKIYESTKQQHRNVPYHNWEHAKDVAHAVGLLDISSEITKILKISALFHDNAHLYKAQEDDEIISSQNAKTRLNKSGVNKRDISKIETAIMGTVFAKRKDVHKSGTFEQKLLADCDVSIVGRSYEEFLPNSSRLYIEQFDRNSLPSEEAIIKYFEGTLHGFFGFLTGTTGEKNNPFLTKEAQKAFPHFEKNRERLASDLKKNTDFLIQTVKEQWEIFYGYKLVFVD